MKGMTEAIANLETEKTLSPANPCLYFTLAQNTFYTSKIFGCGKDETKSQLIAATAKFEIFKPLNNFMPNWGKERNAALLADCK